VMIHSVVKALKIMLYALFGILTWTIDFRRLIMLLVTAAATTTAA
jgi:hypothetical protein